MDRKDTHASKRASFVAVVLPRSASVKQATDAAIKHITDREKTQVDKAIVEPIADKTGTAIKDLTVKGLTLHRARLSLRTGDDPPYRYADVAAAIDISASCRHDDGAGAWTMSFPQTRHTLIERLAECEHAHAARARGCGRSGTRPAR